MTDQWPRTLLTGPEVALRLRRSTTWFYRNRARLEAEHGFPRPVDGCGMRWDPEALMRWLDARLPNHEQDNDPASLAERRLIERARASRGAAAA